MKEVLLFAIAILFAGESLEPTSSDSICARYASISSDYHRAMADARSKGAAQEEMLRIGSQRQEAFRALIVAGIDQPDQMNAADWAALGMASEYLFLRNECIKYSSRAIELDPSTKEAYEPLTRSLLNANRVDDAERALESAEKYVKDGSRWHGAHFMFFVKYVKQEAWGKATSHCQTALAVVLHEGGQNAIEVRDACRHLSAYLDVAQKAGLQEQVRDKLTEWSGNCADKLDHLLNDDCAGVSELQHCASLCEARCEIAKCLPEHVFDEYLVLWAKSMFHPRWGTCESESLTQQVAFGRYVVANAEKVWSWSNVVCELSSIEKYHAFTGSDERSNASRAILLKVKSFADIQHSKGTTHNVVAEP